MVARPASVGRAFYVLAYVVVGGRARITAEASQGGAQEAISEGGFGFGHGDPSQDHGGDEGSCFEAGIQRQDRAEEDAVCQVAYGGQGGHGIQRWCPC